MPLSPALIRLREWSETGFRGAARSAGDRVNMSTPAGSGGINPRLPDTVGHVHKRHRTDPANAGGGTVARTAAGRSVI